MSTKALKFTALLFLLLLAMVVPLHAATNASIFIDPDLTPTNQTPANCDAVVIVYHAKVTAGINDGGAHFLAITMTDANGNALGSDFFREEAEGETDHTATLKSLSPQGITARPITFALYDISSLDVIDVDTIDAYNFARSGPLLAQTVIDPGTFTVNHTCENLPLIGNSSNCPSLPSGSVVGHAPYPTQIYWEPGKESPGILLNPGNYWVIGTDESGKFYKIMLSCDFVWVPVQNFQPSYEAPQTGQPLPTTVVK